MLSDSEINHICEPERLTEDMFDAAFKEILSRLVGWIAPDLDEFLLPETDPLIVAYYDINPP